MNIKKYLNENILVTDGAMGTYFSAVTGREGELSELSNMSGRSAILSIHEQYIAAGAKLIRTNTFSANSFLVGDKVKEIISAGCEIAKEAAKGKAFVGASIGPVPDMENGVAIEDERIINEYRTIADLFLENGIDIFVFETFSSLDYLEGITKYIREKNEDAFILTQFASTLSGLTRKGLGIKTLIENLQKAEDIDAYGFNCGVGPYHLYNMLKDMDFGKDIVSALPNAGYPQIINERTVFSARPEYFAESVVKIKDLGVKIIGGCCGTTPQYIKEITKALNKHTTANVQIKKHIFKESGAKKENAFADKLAKCEFTIAVELDSPMNADISNFMKGAAALKATGADILTIADSPLARPRIDSIVLSAKAKREIGIDVMPHIACRDRNVIAMRAVLLGGYIEDIRNLLIITGDSISSPNRVEIKSVFNLNAYRLMNLIKEMNREKFPNDNYFYGGAININAANIDAELRRLDKKIDAGASFFLTQPVFDECGIERIERIKREFDGIKVLAGIMPIVSYNNARFLANEIPGMNVPDDIIDMFSNTMTREEASEAGVNIAVNISSKVKDISDGFYFMTPFGRYEMIEKIIENVRH